MAKRKGRGRQRRPASRSTRSSRPAATRATPKSAPTSSAPAASEAPDFAAEYRYVVSDLKRIGLLAAAMFTALIVLSLFIH